MIYVVYGIALLFIGLGFLVNKENAQYLLSGYNTMSEAERETFPLEDYLRRFKYFHLFFGLTFAGIGTLLFVLDLPYLGHHLGITPILAYLFFFLNNKDLQGENKGAVWVGVGVLLATLVGVVVLFIWSDSDSSITIYEDRMQIDGPYGTELFWSELSQVTLVSELPEIKSRLHGISTETTAKGKFSGPHGERYLLLLDKPFDQILIIERHHLPPVLLSLNTVDEQELFDLIQLKLDDLNPLD